VRRAFYRFLQLGVAGGLAVWLLGGCAWFNHHPHKAKSQSYDRSISDEDRDPTYKSDPERADEEVRDVQ
jgi:hypothetical protein